MLRTSIISIILFSVFARRATALSNRTPLYYRYRMEQPTKRLKTAVSSTPPPSSATRTAATSTTTMAKPQICIIAGPTAVGKSKVALELALNPTARHIISVDSVQAYKHVQIGANKPSVEELKIAPQHLVSIIDAHETYTAADFRSKALQVIEDITANEPTQSRIWVVGGTMMYIDWFLHGFPDAPATSDAAIAEANQLIGTYKEEGDWEGATKFLKEKFCQENDNRSAAAAAATTTKARH